MNQPELSCTAQLGPEMEEGTRPGTGVSIGILLGSAEI